MENRIEVNGLSEMGQVAKKLLNLFTASKSVDQATVVAISGDLGAGKTTFVQHLAKEMGIIEAVTSPTFTIMKLYPVGAPQSFQQLIHMDAYRIDSLDELRPLHLSEIFTQTNSLVCIEWAEKIKDFLPVNTIYLSFETLSEDSRVITITGGQSAI
jgi:tRNA threonylcarbamoyladenosine biosynthesis protein TsaE